LRDMLVNRNLPQNDLKRGLNALVKIAKEIKSNPEADTNQKRSADNLINLANMILKNIHHMPEIRGEAEAALQKARSRQGISGTILNKNQRTGENAAVAKLFNSEKAVYFGKIDEGWSHADAIKAARIDRTNIKPSTETEQKEILRRFKPQTFVDASDSSVTVNNNDSSSSSSTIIGSSGNAPPFVSGPFPYMNN